MGRDACFKAMDENGDGAISYDEWLSFFLKISSLQWPPCRSAAYKDSTSIRHSLKVSQKTPSLKTCADLAKFPCKSFSYFFLQWFEQKNLKCTQCLVLLF